jgi:hypothetical protein
MNQQVNRINGFTKRIKIAAGIYLGKYNIDRTMLTISSIRNEIDTNNNKNIDDKKSRWDPIKIIFP